MALTGTHAEIANTLLFCKKDWGKGGFHIFAGILISLSKPQFL